MSAPLAALPPALFVFALALAAALLPRRAGHAVGVAGGLATCAWLLAAPAGVLVEATLFGFEAVLFYVDPYSRLLGAAFGFVAAAGVAYGFATGADRRQTSYALAYVGAGIGAVVAGDWLTLVVFWELMAVCATALIWHRTADRGSGVRYAIYHEIGGLALMAGVLLHYAEAGTFLFGDGIAAGLPATLVALGIGLNAGFLGLHVWLVDAYPKTHVASSVVLAAVTTKVGAFAIVRAFPDGAVALAYVGAAMVLFGVTFAVLQTDVRRLLSYHIVSQVGYAVAGFGAGSALAGAGAMAHLVNNVLYKSLLFMVAGVLVARTGRESLKRMGGLGRALPLTAAVFAVAALSIAGVPGFNGFVSKAMVVDGVEKTGLEAVWWALVVGGVGTVVSFAKFGYYAFLREPAGSGGEAVRGNDRDLDPVELGAMASLAALCVAIGVAPGLLLERLPAAAVAGAKPFAAKQFLKAGAVTATGLVVFLAVRPRLAHVTPVPDLERLYHPLGRRLQDASVAVAGTVDDAIETTATRSLGASETVLSGNAGSEDGGDGGGGPATPRPGTIGTALVAVAVALLALFAVLLA